MAALGQPQRHVAQAGAYIQHAQRTLRQGFKQIGLQHCQTDRAFGPAVDFFSKACGELIEMTIAHWPNRRSLSASLLRTTASMSSPSSLHSSNRYNTMSPTSCPAWVSLSAGNWRDWSDR